MAPLPVSKFEHLLKLGKDPVKEIVH